MTDATFIFNSLRMSWVYPCTPAMNWGDKLSHILMAIRLFNSGWMPIRVWCGHPFISGEGWASLWSHTRSLKRTGKRCIRYQFIENTLTLWQSIWNVSFVEDSLLIGRGNRHFDASGFCTSFFFFDELKEGCLFLATRVWSAPEKQQNLFPFLSLELPFPANSSVPDDLRKNGF